MQEARGEPPSCEGTTFRGTIPDGTEAITPSAGACVGCVQP